MHLYHIEKYRVKGIDFSSISENVQNVNIEYIPGSYTAVLPLISSHDEKGRGSTPGLF